jgi:isocitrate dehydrogenase
VSINEDVNTYRGVKRIVQAAFDFAVERGHKRVTMCDKANAMPHAHGLWRRVFAEVAADYPFIETEAEYVDALMMKSVVSVWRRRRTCTPGGSVCSSRYTVRRRIWWIRERPTRWRRS